MKNRLQPSKNKIVGFFNERLAILFLCLLSLTLVLVWFKDNKLLATGEEGLMLARPERTFELFKYSWVEVGPGYTSPSLVSRLPFFYLASFVSRLGIAVWLFQAIVFFILIFIGMVSVFYLTKELFGKKNEKSFLSLPIVASIFYLLNPISLLGVWYRFIYTFMFFFAFAPLFFLLYLKGFRKKDMRFIFFLSLISFFFSYAYGSPSLVPLIWFLPFIYTVITVAMRKISIAFALKFFTLSLVFWILTNLWWIAPYVSQSVYSFSSESSLQHNIGTLTACSKDYTLINVIRLIHAGILYRGEAFGPIYKTGWFLVLSFVTPILVIFGLVSLKNRLLKHFFWIAFLILIFLSKGTSSPFGGVFLWLFKNIPGMILFRNPLEKFGLLLPIVYSQLFALGTMRMASLIKASWRKPFLLFVMAVLVITNWPLFTGEVMAYGNRDIRVEIPDSFEKINELIDDGQRRILSLPLTGGSSGFYDWEYGYKGVESSEFLFDQPVVAALFSKESFFDQIVVGISQGKAKNNLIGIAQFFSTDLIAFRKDTDVKAHGAYFNYLEIAEAMTNQAPLTRIFDSKEVLLWELSKEDRLPLFYIPKSVIYGNTAQDLLTLLDDREFKPKDQVFLTTEQTEIPDLGLIPDSISVVKISPSEFKAKIQNSKGEFLLVFNNTFHPSWKVQVNNRTLDDNKHVLANGYANGFLINEKGDLDVSILFTEQMKFDKWLSFSVIAGVIGFITATFLLRRKKEILK